MKVTVKTINPKIATDVVSTNLKYTWSIILLNGVMFIIGIQFFTKMWPKSKSNKNMPFYKTLLKRLVTCKHSAGLVYFEGSVSNRLRTEYKTRTNYKMRTRHYRLSINHGLGINRRLPTVYTKTVLEG